MRKTLPQMLPSSTGISWLTGFILFCACCFQNAAAFAQANYPQPYLPAYEPVFVEGEVSRVDIIVDPGDLAAMYADPWSDFEYPADFVFSSSGFSDSVLNVGFRPRGNFSRGAGKKSFKVAINSFAPRRWQGFEKLNLNGQHNDPSIVRTHLSYEMLRHLEVPAPRSSHTELYINGDYYGLYINVEHIDEEFAMNRFGNNDGNLFKCTWPADMDWLGSSQSAYESTGAFELKTNKLENDWSDLIHFIDVLNNTPVADLACELPKVFNVENYLKCIAFDVMSANWDGPVFNKNNFYLYHNVATGQFEYVPYDLDNTFGISWFGIDWTNRDIYNWSNTSEPRPLYTQILAVPEFRERYTHYIEELAQYFDSATYPALVDSIKAVIRPYAVTDTYRTLDYGFDLDDFDDSYDMALGGHVTEGIKGFAQARATSALAQVVASDAAPSLTYGYLQPTRIGEDIPVSVHAADDVTVVAVTLTYSFDGGAPSVVNMLDDGLSQDGAIGDGRYGFLIPGQSTAATLTYLITATDDGGNSSQLGCEDFVQLIDQEPIGLHINEFMAWNQGSVGDPFGDTDDWVEIYNSGTDPIYLGDKFLSDNRFNPDKWQLPDMTLEAGDFVLIWCDENGSQGEMHANFQLDNNGEEIGIFDSDANGNQPIHLITYGPQLPDITQGCLPDGAGPIISLAAPTPGFSNLFTGIAEEEVESTIQLYPNPTTGQLYLQLRDTPVSNYVLTVVDLAGNVWASYSIYGGENSMEAISLDLPAGLYLLQLTDPQSGFTHKAKKITVID